jgi:putative hydrolase of the HAD superfamily
VVDGRIQLLWAADFRSWISVEPGTVDLLGELHDGGTRLALLSNAASTSATRSVGRRSPRTSSGSS